MLLSITQSHMNGSKRGNRRSLLSPTVSSLVDESTELLGSKEKHVISIRMVKRENAQKSEVKEYTGRR